MELLGDVGHVNVVSVHLETMLVSMELLGDISHVESRFGPFRDNISVSGR
jgi:hypothetical protein